MAKQAGPIHIVGTFGPVCFYKAGGEYYVRMTNGLTAKKVKTDKRFEGTMRESGYLGRGVGIASYVYRALPKAFRQYWMFRSFIGEAAALLRQGKTVEEAKLILWKVYAEVWVMKEAVAAEQSITSAQTATTSKKLIKRQGKRFMPALPGRMIAALSPQQKPVKRILPKHWVPPKILAANTG